ncbi:MAG: hypothetical protein PUG96_02570 [Prevotellaceae bacterium]|nr:hypothetical protein [Prevotellaceae bacterium]
MKRNSTIFKATQWAVATALGMWLSVAVFILMGGWGEISFAAILAMKLMSAASIYASAGIAKVCKRKGLLPAAVVNYVRMCLEEKEGYYEQ